MRKAQLRDPAAGFTRGLLFRSALLNKGAGNAGCALHPRPPVQQKSTGVSNQGYTATAGIPCTMVLRLIRDLPGDRALLPPSPVRRLMRLHELSASVGAPGPHDFAVREAARTSAHSPRPPHPASNVRDDRETPLVRRRDRIAIFLFLPGCQEKFGYSEIGRSVRRENGGATALQQFFPINQSVAADFVCVVSLHLVVRSGWVS